MKGLLRIIFLLASLHQFNAARSCIYDKGNCIGNELLRGTFCLRFGESCAIVKECKRVSFAELANNPSCLSYPVSEKNKICIENDDPNIQNQLCIEKELCSRITESKTYDECRKYAVSKVNFICVNKSDGTGCEEKKICPTYRNLTENEQCTDFAANDGKKVCIKNDKGDSCKEEYICNLAIINNKNDDCSNYIVSDDKKFICQKNNEDSSCKEVQLCNTINGEELNKELSDSDCNIYPVSIGNKDTHLCIKDPKNNKCIEQILCEFVQKSTNEIICSDYPVKLENTDTHICSKSSNEETPCIEKEKFIISTTIPNEIKTSNIDPSIISTTTTITNNTYEKEIKTSNIVPSFISTTTITNHTYEKEIKTSNILKIESTSVISTDISLQTTIPSTSKETSSIIFLGCSQITKKNTSFNFNIYFIPTTNTISSEELMFPLTIIYNTFSSQDIYSKCILNKDKNETTISYLCEVKEQSTNIDQIKLRPYFYFTSQDKVYLAGITPIAKISMNNLEKIDNKFNNLLLSNPNIYIINNSIVNRYQKNIFNISGIINGDKPKNILVNKNLSLMINLENNKIESQNEITKLSLMINLENNKIESQNEITKEINCITTDIINNKYTLDCQINDENIYNLQGAVSIIEDGILIIMNENKKGLVFYPESDNGNQILPHSSKKSKGIGAGAIAAIISAILVALASAIIITIFCVRKNHQKDLENKSEIKIMNNKN